MTQMAHFLRFHWKEVLLVNLFPQCVIAAIYSFKLSVLMATVFIGLALMALIFGAFGILAQQKSPLRGEAIAFQIPRKGMIFTVGMRPDTIRMSLDKRRPDYIALICSSKSELMADELLAEFGYDEDHYKKEIVDPQKIEEIRTKTGLIIDWLTEKGLEADQIAADITCGMTTMSVAVFSVTEERQIDSQYIKSQYDEKIQPIKGTQEAVFVSRYSSNAKTSDLVKGI